MKAIINGNIITGHRVLKNHGIVFDKNIVAIIPEDQLNQYELSGLMDAEGRYLSPGFIDIHVHGCSGFDTMDRDENALDMMSKSLLQTGVTSFLPTTMTMEFSRIDQSMERIRKAMGKTPGAEVLGCHMEGPFINENQKGAQDKRYIIMPDISKIEAYFDVIKIITLAPELAGDSFFIEACVTKGVIVSIGHSNATYDQAMAAIYAGASHMTHTCNALPALHHRRPGAIGAAMDSDVVCELIADNIHVHPAMQRILLKLKGINNIILVTDAMRASLLGEGQYDLGGQRVTVEKGEAHLEDGAIAGSVLALNKAVYNFMNNTGVDLVSAVQMVTLNPARQLGIADDKGSLQRGKHADMIIFDKDLTIFATFVRGELLYRR